VRRRRKILPRFVLVGPDGELKPWQIRAGMVITKTIYSHEERRVFIVVKPAKDRAEL
jgi:hypothetical protein